MKSTVNKLAAGLLAAATMLGAAGAAPAAETPNASPPPPAWGPMRLYSKLGLSAEQQQAVQSLIAAAAPGLKSLRAQMRSNDALLLQTAPSDPNHAAVLTEVSQQNGALLSQWIAQREELYSKIYAQLNPTQQAELTALKAKWQPGGHGGWRHHPGGQAGAAAAPLAP